MANGNTVDDRPLVGVEAGIISRIDEIIEAGDQSELRIVEYAALDALLRMTQVAEKTTEES